MRSRSFVLIALCHLLQRFIWYSSIGYYYGPIKMTDSGFYDPSGGRHSRQEFDGFKKWKQIKVVVWPSLLLVLLEQFGSVLFVILRQERKRA
jgi:hypothetical protein